MAKTGGYVARLREKEKARVMKLRLGNERGVMSYCLRAHSTFATPLDRKTVEDKPTAKPYEAKDRSHLPMKSDWLPKPFGKKRRPIKWAGGVMV